MTKRISSCGLLLPAHYLASLLLLIVIAAPVLVMASPANRPATTALSLPTLGNCPALLNFSFRTLGGDKTVNLCEQYKGKLIMIVNTASKCGYTPQYEALEALYREYRDRGFVILGFPSNDFGGQEPGSEQQIKTFCRLTYGVEFPMFEKTHASEKNADPIYQALGNASGEFPSWNFHKYLIDRKGNLVASYQSAINPQSETIVKKIVELL